MDSAGGFGVWKESFFARISLRVSALLIVLELEPLTRYQRLLPPDSLDEDCLATSLLHAET